MTEIIKGLQLRRAHKTTGNHDRARECMKTVQDALAKPPFTSPSSKLQQTTGEKKSRRGEYPMTKTTTTITVTDPNTNQEIVFTTSSQFGRGSGMNGSWHVTGPSEIGTKIIGADGEVRAVAVIRRTHRPEVLTTHPPMTEESAGPLPIFEANLALATRILEGNTDTDGKAEPK